MQKATQVHMRCSIDLSRSTTSTDLNDAADDSVIPCSGRGDCLNGTCLCEIRYTGDECASFNLPYHAGMCLLIIIINLPRPSFIDFSSGFSNF